MSLFFVCQKNHIEIVIIRYKVVQTGPKIQSGGLKAGLFNEEYQGSLKFIVVTLPINEAVKVTKRNNIKVKILFLNMLIIYISKNE